MYHVIGHPASRAIRVLWALEEMALEYTHDPALPRSEAVAALVPTGKIPALRDGDAVLTDSVAIVTYLADKHGQLTYPAGTLERARQDAATQFIVSELDAALWLYGKHSFVLPEDQRVPAVKDTARWEFDRAMGFLEEMRGEGPYIAGEMFTIADIIFSHCAGWGLLRKFALPGGEMGAYLKGLRKRPAMARIMKMVAEQP